MGMGGVGGKNGGWKRKEGGIGRCIAISCRYLADFMPRSKTLIFALIELFT